jgi:hypothetical protein
MRYKNKIKENEKEINLIKNSHTNSISQEEALKFNSFSLKKFYRSSNRSKGNLHKINENDNDNDNENFNLNKFPLPKVGSDLDLKYDNDYQMEKIEEDEDIDLLINYDHPFSRLNMKSPIKEIESKFKKLKIVNKNSERDINDNNNTEFKEINYKNFNFNSNTNSENKYIKKLRTLNTNDTTSPKSPRSSENSFSKNSIHLNYSVKNNNFKFNFFIN